MHELGGWGVGNDVMGFGDHVCCARRSHILNSSPSIHSKAKVQNRVHTRADSSYSEGGSSVQDLPSGETWFL